MSSCDAKVRGRTDDDLAACERLARAVHELDGYPVFLADDDFRGFLAAPGALGAWVAEAGGEIVGHVALHASTSIPVVGLLRSRLGIAASEIGVVARLMVAPSMRRRGVARSLLEVASEEARCRGLVPILDVVPRHEAAIALYENAGWENLGQVTYDLPDGTMVDEFVFRAPARDADAP